MRQKIRSGCWTVPPTGHKKGGGIQGIRTANAAGAETLSDALGTRLLLSIPGDLNRYAQRRMGQCYFQLQTLIYLWPSAERIYGFELIDFL